MDVGISRDSFDVALVAVGSALALADSVLDGQVDNAFALSRPPGHHAEHNQALGFCVFNNVAIAARYLQRTHGVDKILILDWDVHHGNGTQHTFEEDPSVLYVSTHQYPFYPGTGAYSETGIGRGAGATLNCPMPAKAGDEAYRLAFAERILPAIEAFDPEFVVLSAGFDAHVEDPLAHICVSTECFGWMSERVVEVAERHAGGRLLSMLEGGYNLDTLPLCVAEHLQVLAGVERD
jgi:acetoin utilization deacetylase AcuC-like enzyme